MTRNFLNSYKSWSFIYNELWNFLHKELQAVGFLRPIGNLNVKQPLSIREEPITIYVTRIIEFFSPMYYKDFNPYDNDSIFTYNYNATT